TRCLSDWSSDVCSSDLLLNVDDYGSRLGKSKGWEVISMAREPAFLPPTPLFPHLDRGVRLRRMGEWLEQVIQSKNKGRDLEALRSEERRVGKEWRSRRS